MPASRASTARAPRSPPAPRTCWNRSAWPRASEPEHPDAAPAPCPRGPDPLARRRGRFRGPAGPAHGRHAREPGEGRPLRSAARPRAPVARLPARLHPPHPPAGRAGGIRGAGPAREGLAARPPLHPPQRPGPGHRLVGAGPGAAGGRRAAHGRQRHRAQALRRQPLLPAPRLRAPGRGRVGPVLPASGEMTDPRSACGAHPATAAGGATSGLAMPVPPSPLDGPAALPDADALLLQQVTAGEPAPRRRAVAKTITLLESSRDDHRLRADALLNALLPHTGRSFRLGISGVPGVGKSTFIEALGLHLIGQGHRVAVLVCEAAGHDVVIVETVGVGQSETAVHGMTDMFCLLQLPNAGDELQAIKKGVMELADLVVINKADLDEMAATRAQAQITSALRLLGMHGNPDHVHHDESIWHPQVIRISALKSRGLEDFWGAVSTFRRLQEAN